MKTLEKHITMGNHCLVLRSFQGARKYSRGEIVDASNWRTADNLVELRYLRRLPLSYRPPKAGHESEKITEELEEAPEDLAEVSSGVDS